MMLVFFFVCYRELVFRVSLVLIDVMYGWLDRGDDVFLIRWVFFEDRGRDFINIRGRGIMFVFLLEGGDGFLFSF